MGEICSVYPTAGGMYFCNLLVNSHASVRYSTPFGGFKASGLGRELGPDALDAFTDVKNVFIGIGQGIPVIHGREQEHPTVRLGIPVVYGREDVNG